MKAIFLNELRSFFGAPTGYVILALYSLLTGLFIWVLPSPFYLPDRGVASLQPLFEFTPWVFMVLVPAITMRTFAEERNLGTLELLRIKPIGLAQLVLGKFLASWLIVLLSVLPSLFFLFPLGDLGIEQGNYDQGVLIGSYIGLLFLAAAFSALGLLTSSWTAHQIWALLGGILGCFLLYYGFDAVSGLFDNGSRAREFQAWGGRSHFEQIARGILDTADLWYFLLIALVFLGLSFLYLKYEYRTSGDGRKRYFRDLALLLASGSLLLWVGRSLSLRFDLTEDRRYTLTEASLEAVSKLRPEPIEIDVLLGDNLPGSFDLLRQETELLIGQYAARHGNLRTDFFDPLEDEASPEEVLERLVTQGITPFTVTEGKALDISQRNVFPWAVISWGGRSVRVPLLKKVIGGGLDQRIDQSVQELEYAFADAFRKLGMGERKRLGLIDGQGEWGNRGIADFMFRASEYYDLVRISLDSSGLEPNALIDSLRTLDALLIAHPRRRFSEEKQYLLDQYLASGGRGLWLLEAQRILEPGEVGGPVESNASVAIWESKGLDELLFQLGLRFRRGIVSDLYCTPIVLATGTGRDRQYNPLLWVYYPMVFPNKKHPVSANIQPLQFRYTGGFDTLPREGLLKTVLLQSSPLSRLEGFPRAIDLQLAGEQPDQSLFEGKGNIPLGVLIEGRYRSFYANKIKPLELNSHRDQGDDMRLLVIADGDLIANQFDPNGVPLELGYDKWTNSFYGNKALLINALHYLMEEEALLNSRGKTISIPRLDPLKLDQKLGYWQVFTLIWPLVLIFLTGFGLLRYRRYRYRRPASD